MHLQIDNDMRWRVLALVSLGVNLVLACVWLSMARHSGAGTSAAGATNGQGSSAQTNLVVRRQFFSWREVESPDYPTYIANLRDIGCPEQTIRDIIIADVNALYARKRATELVTADQQWWRSEPDPAVSQMAQDKSKALEEERRALLTRLLGANWESGDMISLPRPTRQGIVLDGPVLGVLPADIKQSLQEISAHSQDRMHAYIEGKRSEGKNLDPAELAKLRQQTREELARVLSPAQLEEFLLRYSQEATDLRAEFAQLKYFNPTPDEFRSIFRATDSFDQQIQALAANDPGAAVQRKALEDAREIAIKTALGPTRYEDYRLLQDPLYREAVATAQQSGRPESAGSIYAGYLAAAQEQARIRSDATLTDEQKAIELKQLELDQLKVNALAAGQRLPPEPPGLTAPTPSPPRRTYMIQPGDSLAVVSMIYGIPVGAIRQANPNVNFSRLRPGDAVVIPNAGPPPGAAP
jgi:LysM repeat protein